MDLWVFPSLDLYNMTYRLAVFPGLKKQTKKHNISPRLGGRDIVKYNPSMDK